MTFQETPIFPSEIEWVYVPCIIGSGFEEDIAKLAIEDGIAKRAARKNMQIHSAIVLKIGGEFSGFFTFQNNDVSREFCLLQSVIKPEKYTKALYAQMVREVIARNLHAYPAIITTDPKSKFETPALFESVGFQTYLKMSGFHYMVHGDLADVRMKLLAHITMTNVWNSIKGDWLRLKCEWRERIDAAGEANGVANPAYATREGCWQGEAGFSNVVLQTRTIEYGERSRQTKKSPTTGTLLSLTLWPVRSSPGSSCPRMAAGSITPLAGGFNSVMWPGPVGLNTSPARSGRTKAMRTTKYAPSSRM